MRRTVVARAAAAAAAVVASALLVVSLPAAAAGRGHPGPRTAAPPTVATRPAFGVTMPGLPDDLAPLRDLSASLGRSPDRVMWYVAWSQRSAFPAAAAAAVAATGATPVITWEPWDPSQGVDQPAYSLQRIAAGAFDPYVTSWAKQIKAYGKPVVLRFAHEMNGDWYPWSAQANGNTASDFVRAWKQVRSVFTKQRVANVTWSWSPNVPYDGSTPMRAVYPGDRLVDEVALDGYNWGGVQDWATWTSFDLVFGAGITELTGLTTKPLYLGEVGCPEDGGDKAAWVSGMFASLADHPEVRGFTWFDFDKEADWRLDSAPATLDAFRTGLAAY